MQIKIATKTELNEISANRKKFAFVHSTAKAWRPGAKIEFVMDQGAPAKQKQAKVMGIAVVDSADEIEITHDFMELQKVGALQVNGFKYSRSEAHRFAHQHGFLTERGMYLYFGYKWKGKLVKWKEANF